MPLENLALDKKFQPSFNASVKKIRKNLKAEDDEKPTNFSRKQKGLVKLSSIPYGFFETAIRKYFQQFGYVTRVRVARSKKTGNSKGFAFVEFKYPDVAKVVAETMNNYLMFDKILKAKYIPPEEQKFDYFRGVVENKVPRDRNRRIHVSAFNRMLSQEEKKKYCERASKQLKDKLKKLKHLGIDYKFEPVVKCRLKKEDKPVLTIDESDEEIAFKIPRNVTVVRKKSTSKNKEEMCSNEKISDMNERMIHKSTDFAESNMTQKDIEKLKVKKRTRSNFQVVDNGEKNALTLTDKNKGILKNKSRKKDSFSGFMALDSTNSTKISKPSKIKPLKSFSSMWKVKDCS